jgi:N-acetylmuramoyl-L-alanine amidase
VVERGDTLASIARCHGTTVWALQRENDLGSSIRIRAGELLFLPAGAKAGAKAGGTSCQAGGTSCQDRSRRG